MLASSARPPARGAVVASRRKPAVRVVAAAAATDSAAIGTVQLGKTGASNRRSARRRRPALFPPAHSPPPPPPPPQKAGLEIPPLGFGAWSWGDRSNYWGYQKTYQKADNSAAYTALQRLAAQGKIPGGRAFIDTAEVYGYGLSETFIGEFMREEEEGKAAARGGAIAPRPFICTKFAPLPWRVSRGQVTSAAKASAERLGVSQIDLYIQHWPGFLTSGLSNAAFAEGLADVAEAGIARAVGASNFNARRVREAADALERRGLSLSSNQVQYSLLYRAPESNGVLEACRERGATLVAYSPLTQGLLTGAYRPGGPLPSGPRAALYGGKIKEISTLLDLMKQIGDARGGKTPAQVALNWIMKQGIVPIPGAKNARQVEDLVGACGWCLDDGEWDALDAESRRVKPPLGAPFENW
jgi:aryl-alcohol dehydrogenase-like predicted oxidoreductase